MEFTQYAAGEGSFDMQQAPQQVVYGLASLYVGDLKPDVTDLQLFELFKTVGPVASVHLCRDATTNVSLGYAYVNYSAATDAQKAIDTLNYTAINGHPCRVMWSYRDSAMRLSPAANLFVRGLAPTIDTPQLHKLFGVFGTVSSCKVDTDLAGVSKGIGFVQFEKEADAAQAIEKLNNTEVEGKQITVGVFKSRKERMADDGEKFHQASIFVKNLPEAVDTDEKLKSMFASFGEIVSAVVVKDQEGKPRGFGYVNFKAKESADKVNQDWATVGSAAIAAVIGTPATAAAAAAGDNKVEVYPALKKTNNNSRGDYRFSSRRQPQQMAQPQQPSNHHVSNVYVGNLPDTATEDQLFAVFNGFGKVVSVKIVREKDHTPKGYGFVSYHTAEEVQRAISQANGVLIGNKPLVVSFAEYKMEDKSLLSPTTPKKPLSIVRPKRKLLLAPDLDTTMPTEALKQAIGERLFGMIFERHPDEMKAGKLTGMFLELPQEELFRLLDTPVEQELEVKLNEAVALLEAHQGNSPAPAN